MRLIQPLQGNELDENTWEELFLLKVNVNVLEHQFNELSSNDLIKLKVSKHLNLECILEQNVQYDGTVRLSVINIINGYK